MKIVPGYFSSLFYFTFSKNFYKDVRKKHVRPHVSFYSSIERYSIQDSLLVPSSRDFDKTLSINACLRRLFQPVKSQFWINFVFFCQLRNKFQIS